MTAEQLAQIQRRADAAQQHVADLCAGKVRWTMRIPAEPDRDSDLVISDSLADIDTLLAAVRDAQQRAEQAEQALEPLARERNTWARQLADLRDERDAARGQADRAFQMVGDRENTILRVGALLHEWQTLGRGDGIHGQQIRQALDGEATDGN